LLVLSFSLLAAAAPAAGAPVPTPPAVAIYEPSTGATLSGEAVIRGTAHATNGSRIITLVEVQVDAGAWSTASGTTAWSFRLDTAPLDDGWHNLRVRSYDGWEYSEPAGIEFQSRNAGSSGVGLGPMFCIVLAIMIAVVLGAFVVYYINKAKPAGSPPLPAGAPALRTFPYAEPPLHVDSTGRLTRYGTPRPYFYQPTPPLPAYPRGSAPPARVYSPGGAQASTEAIPVEPEEAPAAPAPIVVEHDNEPAPEVIEVGEAAAQEAPEVIYMGPSAETAVDVMPEDIPGAAEPPSADERRERVKRALLSMPRGIPLPLLGITTDELAEMIVSAPPKKVPGGSPAVQLKGRWYRADENDLKDFMVECKP
jgi:hypothetical protein